MMEYELVVVWENGDRDVYEYRTRADAEQGEKWMLMANGDQIQWSGIRRKA